MDFAFLQFNSNIRSNYWFYSLLIKDNSKLTKETVIDFLAENNIQARPLWGLIHEQKPYLNNQNYKIEKAKYYAERVINIPCSSNLNEEDIDYILKKLHSIG